MISFIIPAYNEERDIANVIHSIREAAAAVDVEHEIIVVNDASSDRTAECAAEAGACVIHVEHRKISAVRNAGAAAARGSTLVFVDGDTLISAGTLRAALQALHNGAVGGGALAQFPDDVSRVVRLMVAVAARGLRVFGCCGGCFMFVRRDAFERVGGFDERYFASEEIWLARTLRRTGRFVVLNQTVVTSSRKFRMLSTRGILWQSLIIGLRGPSGLTRRDGLEVWYDGRRE